MNRATKLDTDLQTEGHLQKLPFALQASNDVIKSQLVLTEVIRNIFAFLMEGCILARKFLWKVEILKHLLW